MSQPQIEVETHARCVNLRFRGRLDSAGSSLIQAAVLEHIAQVAAGQRLRFDLAGVDFVASAFLRLCIQAAKALGSERFELARLTPGVREVFAMAGLDRHLRLVE